MEKLTSRTGNIYLSRIHWEEDENVPISQRKPDGVYPTITIIPNKGKAVNMIVSEEQLEMLHDASWRLMRSGK